MKQTITITVVGKSGNVIAQSSSESGMARLDFVHVYEEGDKIVVEASATPQPLKLRFDAHVGESRVYLTAERMEYPVPLGLEHDAYPPEAFMGEQHQIEASCIGEAEWNVRRNLSENPLDRRGDTTCYPHCTANAETRGESVFAARNVIDGSLANTFHGEWPYTSWGEDERTDAEIMIEFGREVWIDETRILIRADFPHDNYWTQCRICFSDGSDEILPLIKTEGMQCFSINPRAARWVKLKDFVRSEEPSPFPALSEWEVYGSET